ncbi:cell envelope integrity protein TolA [Undibacterium sp. CY21W]|uniref:cell envelope integrity protein TolA n=1 Tax=Undibacterium sp. CY21W TaxID=2762293 RepID=UPI00164A7EBD|nr:cell envelope integrity protein TolA [Undibacterium sp. CY21W]MBC3929112.1 cell envelope integrity protein TolA [Undibacterium sp. CY21W]
MNQVSISAYPGNLHQSQAGNWRPVVLAALVHVLLLGFLWIGVSWQNKESTAVEAEVWDMTTREAAPVAVEIPPAPPPEPEPVKLKDIPPPPPAVKNDLPKEDPEIALQQEKKRLLAEKKKAEEHQRALAEEKRQAEQELQAKKDKEREKLREKEREQEKERQKEKDKEKEKERDKEKAEKQKLADQKAQQAKDKAASDKLFKENMQRLSAQAGVTGSGGTGTAAKSTGNNRGDPSYMAKIAAKVRSNTIYSGVDAVAGNPTVEYRIELIPDGSLRGAIKKLKSSGNLAFDDAVAKGIEKSAPFPKDKNGQVPGTLDFAYKMKEE